MEQVHSGPGAVKASMPSRLVRWFRKLPRAGQVVLGGATLVAFFGLFFAEENWRGERAWEKCRRQLEAKGVELDWSKFAPAPVPDEQNFAMTPFLVPLFDFNPSPLQPGQKLWRDTVSVERAQNFGAELLHEDKPDQIPRRRLEGQLTDLEEALMQLKRQSNASSGMVPAFDSRTAAAAAVLDALKDYRPVLEELQAASRRPFSRFKVQYDAEDPMTILLPHYRILQQVAKVLQVRGSAELALDKPGLAYDDLRLMLFLVDSVRAEPFLVTMNVRANLLSMAERLLWEGLGQHLWSESQLREAQGQLSQINMLSCLNRGLQAERAAHGNQLFRYIRTHKGAFRQIVGSDDATAGLTYLLAGPEGWFYQEQAVFHQLFQTRVADIFDVQSGHVNPSAVKASSKALERDLAGNALWHHNAMSRLLLGKLLGLFERAALAQTQAELAATACALERYRLARGGFPEKLEGLVPQFADKIPVDVCGGAPLKYRPIAAGQFLLYGVGWNETDDGGTSVMTESDQGDWVWPPYPTK
jgi:hypothetical protein